MANKSHSKRLFFIPAALGAFFALLYLIPAWADLEFGIYDLFMNMKPTIPEDASIVLLNADDESIVRSGSWPWPRAIVAKGLEALTEFNAAYAVFDIEYLEKSPMTVDKAYMDSTLHSRFQDNFTEIQSYTSELFSSVANKSIPLSSLKTYADELSAEIKDIGDRLFEKTLLVAVPNDAYLGKAMRLFGKAFVTLNRIPQILETTPESLRKLAQDRFPYAHITGVQHLPVDDKDFQIPIEEISSMAAGAGFTNTIIDSDGKRRRIQLITPIEGKPYLQLSFAPLMDSLGNPKIAIEPGKIKITGAKTPKGMRDIVIPIDTNGRMLINWPKKDFNESFNQVSFYKLVEYKDLETDLSRFLSSLAHNEIWKLVPGSPPVDPILALWETAETARLEALESGTPEDRILFLRAKEDFYSALKDFVISNTAQESANSLLIEAKNADASENATLYDALAEKFNDSYKNVRAVSALLFERRTELKKKLSGTYCVIGWTASASTDFGVNPFSKKYANVGTHASVINTILQGQFLRATPMWFSMILSFALPLGLILLIRNMKTGLQIIAGMGATIFLFFASFALFATWGIFVASISPLLAAFTSFLTYTLAVFFLSEKEKSFLKKAFSTYLSQDIISELVNDPSMLKLGGDKKWISAVFTDIKGFSTISEQLDPVKLVSLLNFYLSGMSDIILENRGTIDKFEGDAIIAFFGAPVLNPQHAKSICKSAIEMRKKETEMNARILAEGLSPVPLMTRIGINTGDMVVGNMGTESKMNYTIMGNAVNLAARLEGVNKRYGSWILSTETTKNETGDDFVWRKLDLVRVVGINQPLRLYELLGLSSERTAAQSELLERFDSAREVFENSEWDRAKSLFSDLSEQFPDDGPSKSYIRQCSEMKEKKIVNWDKIFNLTEK